VLAASLTAALAGPALAVDVAARPAGSAATTPSGTSAAAGTAASSPSPSPSASPDAAELELKAAEQAAELSSELAEQQAATRAAAAALETYQVAQRAADEATRQAEDQAARLAEAQARTTEVRARLERYIASLYRTGLGSRELTVYTNLMDARNPQQLFRGLGMVSRIGGNQNDAFVELARAEQAQARASERAAQSAAMAKAASADAQEARIKADEVVAAAAARAAETAAELAVTEEALAIAQEREVLVARATEVARQRSAVPYAAIEGALAPRPVAECKGGELKGFPNGLLPTAALCPLWGHQRPAPASGRRRDLRRHEQGLRRGVRRAAVRHRLLPQPAGAGGRARRQADAGRGPGTSNHGWGVAVDLCGGVERFDTAQHQWMVANSMAFGWFHPGWAQATGSKPEAWHWEFAL
jgi:hypothetical protein